MSQVTDYSETVFLDTALPAQSEKIVLIVEDHFATREAMSMVLRQSGVQVIEAADGVEALDVILKTVPDLILTDLRMPNMDGLELSRYVKSSSTFRHIPIVLISATPPSDKSRHPEIALFIQKPYPIADLLNAITSLI
jgi:CheY-like chemotaxis protein